MGRRSAGGRTVFDRSRRTALILSLILSRATLASATGGGTEREFPVRAEIAWSTGAGERGPISAIAISGNTGSIIDRGRRIDAVVAHQVVHGLDRLAAIIAPTSGDLVVVWAYCDRGRVTRLYRESLDGSGAFQSAGEGGRCTFSREPVKRRVRLATLRPEAARPSPRVSAIAIDGPRLHLAHGAGTVELAGASWAVRAFHVIDCRSGCGGPGWTEVHALLRRNDKIAFGIFYLLSTVPNHVRLEYPFRLDDGDGEGPDPAGFDATWNVATPTEIAP